MNQVSHSNHHITGDGKYTYYGYAISEKRWSEIRRDGPSVIWVSGSERYKVGSGLNFDQFPYKEVMIFADGSISGDIGIPWMLKEMSS